MQPVPAFGDRSFVGGALCLDFVNTVGGHRAGAARELLHGYSDLVRWCRAAGAIDSAAARRFVTGDSAWPELGLWAYEKALWFREDLFRLFSALRLGRSPPKGAVNTLNAVLCDAVTHRRLFYSSGSFNWIWAYAEGGLDALLWPVACSAGDLLLETDDLILRECAGVTCGWLFRDTSKNKTRRWCDMRACGNRAKARRHRNHRRK